MDFKGTLADDMIDQEKLHISDFSAIYGLDGNDTILAAAANVIGGQGNDTIIATGGGATAAYWGSPSAATVDLRSGTAWDGYGAIDTLVNIHAVHGSGNADTLLGSDADDTFYGGSGDDFIDGRSGKDTVTFFFSPSSKFSIGYDENSNTVTIRNTDPKDNNYGTKTLKNIEQIQFTGAGSDGTTIRVSSLLPNGFKVIDGATIDNADAGANPRWAVTDLNGDGRQDIVLRFDPESAFSTTKTGSSPVRFFLQQSDGTYEAADLGMSANLAPTLVNRIVAVDLNGDGKGDLVVGASGQDPYADGKPVGPWFGEVSYELLSNGTSYANATIQGVPKLFAHHVSVGDINGDGSPDVYIDSIWGSPDTASYFLINDGHGKLTMDRSCLPESIANPYAQIVNRFDNGAAKVESQNIYTSSALFDANGDGAIDLAVLPMGGTDVGKVFLSDGKGHFSDDRKILLPPGPFGAGSITWSTTTSSEPATIGSIYLDTVALDINGDGRQDLVSVVTKDHRDATEYQFYQDSAVQILVNTGSGFVDESSTRTDFTHVTGANFTHYDTVQAVDVNSDGFKDVLVYRSQSDGDSASATRILLNDGHGVFKETTYPNGVPEGLFVAIDPNKGQYAVIESGNLGFDPATGLSHYMAKVDAVQFDWALGRDFFTGRIVSKNASLTSDIPGRWIHGTNDNNNIVLSSGDEHAYGYGGKDKIMGGAGDDTIDGGDGIDTTVYVSPRSDFTVTKTATGFTVVDKTLAGGIDTLTSIERIKFGDTALALDTNGNAGQAYRLYQAAFNRKPDTDGLGYWIDYLDKGASLSDMTAGFFNSPEFDILYGANPPNAILINNFYQNVLHRGPDQGGFDWWMNELATGHQSPISVLIGFSESAENQAQIIGSIQNGIQYTAVA